MTQDNLTKDELMALDPLDRPRPERLSSATPEFGHDVVEAYGYRIVLTFCVNCGAEHSRCYMPHVAFVRHLHPSSTQKVSQVPIEQIEHRYYLATGVKQLPVLPLKPLIVQAEMELCEFCMPKEWGTHYITPILPKEPESKELPPVYGGNIDEPKTGEGARHKNRPKKKKKSRTIKPKRQRITDLKGFLD